MTDAGSDNDAQPSRPQVVKGPAKRFKASVARPTFTRPPKPPGIWAGWFNIGRKKINGAYHIRFFCKAPCCRKDYSTGSSSSTMKYHFMQDHPRLYQEYVLKGSSMARIQSVPSDTSRSTAKQEALVSALLDWVVEEYVPLSLFDSTSFQKLMQLADPHSTPPSTAAVQSKLDGHRLELEQQLKNLLEETFSSGAISIEDWTNSGHRLLLGLNLHWLDKNFHKLECTLDLAPHPIPYNAESIQKLVEDAISKKGFDGKITGLTMDNAVVMMKVSELANLPHSPCIASILRNSVLDALHQSKELGRIVNKCRNLATLFYDSSELTRVLIGEQYKKQLSNSMPLTIIVDNKTRWNGTLDMLRRLAQLQDTVDSVYESLMSSTLKIDDMEELEKLMLTESEWNHVKETVTILTLLEEEAQKALGQATSSGLAACILPWSTVLSMKLEGQAATVLEIEDFRGHLQEQLSARVIDSDSLMKASLFHPTFNRLLNKIDESRFKEIKAMLLGEYKEIVSVIAAPNTWQEIAQQLIDMLDGEPNGEFEGYFKRRQCNDIDVDPCQWWFKHRTEFPVMSQLARKYLAIPACSIKSEKVFSIPSDDDIEERNYLIDDADTDIIVMSETKRCLKQSRVEWK
ncbi:hypothetical protein EMPS_10036 [Entomortierella parvispora]|uniref:HAT C-terminal dimerisation domain-containing protein n=1 Tax=Entomortierella parvispora TaxID=205924 RepID=A0A9P3M0Y0_9FUNG|nr:hypothetical protein EMPS_10036 [Entomortierella parvispora]